MIYGGLYSKNNSGFPKGYLHANGVMVDGYLDLSWMGLGTCPLGYADPDVNEAAISAINLGSISTLESNAVNVLGELLLDLHPSMNDVRYAKTGGEAMKVAYDIATNRLRNAGYDDIKSYLFAGYHGWHLSDPRNRSCTLPDLKAIGKLAHDTKYGFYNILIFEPIRYEEPTKEYIALFNELTKDYIVIADEITSGFRFTNGSYALKMGFNVDMIVYAKGISNGYPMAAILGKDLSTDKFISSTYWTDRIGPAAAIATIKKMIKHNVPDHIEKIGRLFNDAAIDNGYKISGTNFIPHMELNEDVIVQMRNYFLKHNILFNGTFYPSFAHTEEHIDQFKRLLKDMWNNIKRK